MSHRDRSRARRTESHGPDVELWIDCVVLDGIPIGDKRIFSDSLQEHLSEALTGESTAALTARPAEALRSLDGGVIAAPSGARPSAFATDLARCIAGSLQR